MPGPLRRRQLATVVALGLLVAGCGSDDDSGTSSGAEPTATIEPGPTGTPEPEPTADDDGGTDMTDQPTPEPSLPPVEGGSVGRSHPGDDYPPELTSIVELAITELAEHLGIDPGAISVVQVDEVTWSDASLGCPQPGRAYAQVVTDGLRILLEADGTFHDYRSGGFADPVRCEPAGAGDATGEAEGEDAIFDLGDDGEIVTVTPAPEPESGGDGPTEYLDPPDE